MPKSGIVVAYYLMSSSAPSIPNFVSKPVEGAKKEGEKHWSKKCRSATARPLIVGSRTSVVPTNHVSLLRTAMCIPFFSANRKPAICVVWALGVFRSMAIGVRSNGSYDIQ